MVGPAKLRQRTVNSLEDRVRIIEKLVEQDMLDPWRGPKLRALAGQIVRTCPSRGNSSEEAAGACELYSVFSFVESNVRYNGDATLLGGKGVDLYQSPLRTLEMGIGDCFPSGTLLLRDDFTFVPVEKIKVGEKIWGYDKWSTVTATACKGLLPLDAVKFNNGNWVRLTPDHKIYISECEEHPYSPDVEPCKCAAYSRTKTTRIKVSELRENLTLLSPKRIAFGTEDGDPDVSYIDGLYLSDGWCSHIYKGHPYDFQISGQDGCPKEDQKYEVEDICERLGIETRWHRKYISVKDREWASRLHMMGGRAPEKHALTINLGEAQAAALLRGIMADSGANATTGRTYTSTSKMLTLQTRILHKMFGINCGWSYIENHGGLGSHPIYRLNAREPKTKDPKPLKVKEIERNVGEEIVYDISTDDHYVYLPEADVTVSNCDDMCGVVLALLRFQGYHAWLRVCSYANAPDEWAHIYAVCLFPKVGPRREVVMDVTLGKDKIGVERPYAKKVDFGR